MLSRAGPVTVLASRSARVGWRQLIGALVLAVALPWLARLMIEPVTASLRSQQNSVAGTLLALVIGHIFFRSLGKFPGIRGGNYVVPTFVVSYGMVLAVFFFLRLDYSRLQFLGSITLCLAWYSWLAVVRRRSRLLRIGVVPAGKVHRLEHLSGVEWRRLSGPDASVEVLDAIVADLRADMPDEWERFLTEAAIGGIPVYHYKQLQESLTGRVEIEHLSENNFGSLIPGLAYVTFKNVTDFVGALVAGTLLLPLFLVAAIAVRLDSPGPVLFRQRRMGYRGEPFTVFKFRTMAHMPDMGEADERTRAITTDGDARITRVGRFLRRSRIDELPQLLNVLRGEMSWIGPRPEAEVLSRWYERELPFYRYRHIVKPGITGWAQVNQGHVADVDDVLWKLHYDFYYIKNFTPWLDILITLRTLHTMFTGFGSR